MAKLLILALLALLLAGCAEMQPFVIIHKDYETLERPWMNYEQLRQQSAWEI